MTGDGVSLNQLPLILHIDSCFLSLPSCLHPLINYVSVVKASISKKWPPTFSKEDGTEALPASDSENSPNLQGNNSVGENDDQGEWR